MLICSAVYAWMQRPRNPVAAQNSPPAAVTHSEPAAPAARLRAAAGHGAGADGPGSRPRTTPAPVARQPAAAAHRRDAAPAPTRGARRRRHPNPTRPVHVEITADEPVWVLARSGRQVRVHRTPWRPTRQRSAGWRERCRLAARQRRRRDASRSTASRSDPPDRRARCGRFSSLRAASRSCSRQAGVGPRPWTRSTVSDASCARCRFRSSVSSSRRRRPLMLSSTLRQNLPK